MPSIVEFRLQSAEKSIEAQQSDIKELRAGLEAFERAEAAKEKKQLTWGIITLGSVVMTLGGVIWAYRGVIFK